jgi:prepilin-type N-terminal cleavage/methylation domain-containing protein
MFSKSKNDLGFTMVEMLVVLVIIIALAMFVIGGYSEGRPRLAVERTAESFIMDLYRVRGRGFYSSLYHDGGSLIEGNYGIKINKNERKYTIFIREGGSDIIIEEIELEGLIKILEIEKSNSVNEVAVLFSSDKKVYFDDSLASGNIEITFSSETDDDIKRIIRINSSGVAEIVY